MIKKFGNPFSILTIVFVISLFFLNEFGKQEQFNYIESKSELMGKIERKKARTDFFFNMLRDPKTNSIPEDMRQKELKYAKSISAGLKKTTAESISWTEVGPNDVGGRTRALAVDVKNSDVVIAAGVSGGIWKSTNNGDTWEFKSKSADLLSVTSLAQDPREGFTNNWYAVGGEYVGSSASDRGYTAYFRGNGIYKSLDNGDTWSVINTTISNPTRWDSDFDYISKIIINPVTGSIFAAAHAEGIIKSTDGGESFSTKLGSINDHSYCDVIIKPNGTLIAMLSSSGFNDSTQSSPGIYMSTDDGENWSNITPEGFPLNHTRTALATSQLNSPIFYLCSFSGEYFEDGSENVILYKLSTDNSVTENLSANLPTFTSELFDFQGYMYTQGNYNLTIAVKPDDDDLVLLGGTSLFRSTDGVSTKISNTKYQWIGGYHGTEFFYPNLHPDIHIISFDPNDPNKVWVGHDGGLSYSTDITDESYPTFFPWVNKNNGYNVTQFYTVSISKLEGDPRIVGGTQDNGSPYFKTNNPSFPSLDVSSGDGAYCYLADKIYAYTSIYEGNIYRFKYNSSGDMVWDASTTNVTPKDATGQLFINPFVIDPNPTERYMYYPAGSSLWRNDDIRGHNDAQPITDYWSELEDLAMPVNYRITTLSVSDINPEHVLYYGGYNRDNTPLIYRLENSHTATTGYTNVSVTDAPAGAYIHNIAINPDDGNEIMVVFSNYNITGLYHSTDGGSSYTAVEGNLTGDDNIGGPSIRKALIHNYQGTKIYFVATSTGLYSTTNLDGDNTVWTQESPDKLGNVVVEHLDIRPVDNTIAVATHGRGIFLGQIGATVDVESDELQNKFALSQNYPNPFNPSTKIDFDISRSDKVSLTVYNNLGERVRTLLDKDLLAGNYTIDFDGSNLASGIYYYKLTAGNSVQTKKMILMK